MTYTLSLSHPVWLHRAQDVQSREKRCNIPLSFLDDFPTRLEVLRGRAAQR